MANGTAPPAGIPLPTNPGVAQSLPPPRDVPIAPQPPAAGIPQRRQGYIPSSMYPQREMTDIGSPDGRSRGLDAYAQMGAWPNSPDAPQVSDYGGMINGLTNNLGRWAAPGVANPMLQAGLGAQFITKDWLAGARGMLDLRLEQLNLKIGEANFTLERELRKYAQAYHMYGTKENFNKDKLLKSVIDAARESGNEKLRLAAEQGDLKAVESYLHYLDNNHRDLDNLHKSLQIELDKRKLDKLRQDDADKKRALDPYRRDMGPIPGADPSGAVTPTPPEAGGKVGPEGPFPEESGAFESPLTTPAAPQPGQPAVPVEPNVGPESDLSRDQLMPQPRGQRQQRPPTQFASAAPGGITGGVPGLGGLPRNLVMQTGAGAPAPPRVVGPQPPPFAAGGGRVPAPAPDTTPRPDPVVAPTPPPPRTEAITPYDPPKSQVLTSLWNQGYKNWQLVNQVALDLLNGSEKTQVFTRRPKIIQDAARVRADEIRIEMNKLLQAKNPDGTPKYQGESVYRALDKLNPIFSSALRTYVDLQAKIPSSAWKDDNYRSMVLAFGRLVDKNFNEGDWRQRYDQMQQFAHGPFAKALIAGITLDEHAGRFKTALKRLETLGVGGGYDQNIFQNFGSMMQRRAGGQWWGPSAGVTPEMGQVLSELQTEMGNVSEEAERAVSPSPSVSGRENFERMFDYKGNIASNVINSVETQQRLAHARMAKLVEVYLAQVKRSPTTLGDTIMRFAAGEAGSDAAKDALGNLRVPTPEAIKQAQEIINRYAQDPALRAAAAKEYDDYVSGKASGTSSRYKIEIDQ